MVVFITQSGFRQINYQKRTQTLCPSVLVEDRVTETRAFLYYVLIRVDYGSNQVSLMFCVCFIGPFLVMVGA